MKLKLLLTAFFFLINLFSTVEAARDNSDAETLFQQAKDAFYNAQTQQLNGQPANEFYAQAIRYISQAVTLDSDSADYALLASRIYRGKGAGSYAQKYFEQAVNLYREEVSKNPDGIGANLDLSIALFAGDIPNVDEAEDLSKKVIKLCKKSRLNAQTTKAYSIALIVNGKIKESRKILDKAVKIDESLEDLQDKFDYYQKIDPSGKFFVMYYMTLKDRNIGL